MIQISIVFNSLPIDGPLRITSDYGPRNTGIENASTFHHGVDLGRDKTKPETNILSVGPGRIRFKGWNKYRGWYIVIQHDGFQSLYQHLKAACTIPIGAEVKAGTILGIMGSTSDKSVLTVPVHLHFAVCSDFSKSTESGRGYMDPEPFLRNIQEDTEMVKLIKIIVDGKEKTVGAIEKDGFNYIKLRDLGDVINVGFDSAKKMPVVSKKGGC